MATFGIGFPVDAPLPASDGDEAAKLAQTAGLQNLLVSPSIAARLQPAPGPATGRAVIAAGAGDTRLRPAFP